MEEARQLGKGLVSTEAGGKTVIGPPSREVRGTLSLRGVVATSDGLPATVPIDLDLRAGESLAVLCDDRVAAQPLADVLAGRTKPHVGEILIDGGPLGSADRLFAVVGPGEPFVEYQLFLQSLIPDSFFAVAANCSDNFIYLPTAVSFVI